MNYNVLSDYKKAIYAQSNDNKYQWKSAQSVLSAFQKKEHG